MTKEEIIEYIMNSPENTNPNVLKGMLDEMGGSSEQIGYKVTIINNTNRSITGVLTGMVKEKSIVLGAGTVQPVTTIEPNSTLFTNFLTLSGDYNFNNEIYLGNQGSLNDDFSVICSSNNWTINYNQLSHVWVIEYSSETAPNTEDITITINGALEILPGPGEKI